MHWAGGWTLNGSSCGASAALATAAGAHDARTADATRALKLLMLPSPTASYSPDSRRRGRLTPDFGPLKKSRLPKGCKPAPLERRARAPVRRGRAGRLLDAVLTR